MDLSNIGKLAMMAFVVMLFIYAFKQIGKNINIPVISKITEEV